MYKKANAEADRLRLFYLNMKYLANLFKLKQFYGS